MARFGRLTRVQLQEVIQNQKSTMVEIMIAAIMARAAKDGDYNRFEFLLQRSYGKVPNENVNINHDYKEEFDQIPRENILELLRQG